MPRRRRYDWVGCRHHVMNRGARHEPVFHDDRACITFIDMLSEIPQRYGLLIHAYALMPNHYHLLVESDRGKLSRAMAFLGSRYTRWVNSRNRGWDGAVFRGRFHSVDVSVEAHWHYLPIYIHLNPVRAGFAANVNQGRWTSHRVYAGVEAVPEWMTTQTLLNDYGGVEGYLKALDEFVIGRREVPEHFDRVSLNPYVRVSAVQAGCSSLGGSTPTSHDVLRAVARVCGVQKKTLKQTQRGRVGNMPRKLAAYWLAVGAGLKNTETGALIGMHPVRVSQAVREVRRKMHGKNSLGTLMAELEQEMGNGVRH